MARLIGYYQTFLDWLEKLSMGIAVLLAGALFLVTASGIIVEQVTGNSLVWVEEINNLLFAWVSFVGAGIIVRQGGHIGVTALYDLLNERIQALLRVFYAALALVIVWVMVWYGLKMAAFVGRSQTSLYLDINLYWYYLSVPVGGALLGLNAVGAALPDPRHRDDPSETPAQSTGA